MSTGRLRDRTSGQVRTVGFMVGPFRDTAIVRLVHDPVKGYQGRTYEFSGDEADVPLMP